MAEATALEIVLGKIHSGAVDDALDMIVEAAKSRQRSKVKVLKKGDRVRLTNSIRPKYLAGVEATVVRQNPTSVVIKLDEAVGKFSAGEINCHPELLEAV